MQHYLFQGSYSAEGWDALVKNPHNRFEAIRPVVEKLGGKVEHGWLAFGEHDVTRVAEPVDLVHYGIAHQQITVV